MTTYKQIRTLRTRGPVDQEPDREVDGVLLVGQAPALEYEDRHSNAGHDRVSLYPAFASGTQCWLELRRWCAAHGYCASGVQELVLPFDDGVRVLCDRGVFALEAPAHTRDPLCGFSPDETDADVRAAREVILRDRDLARSTRRGWAETAARNGEEYAPHASDLERDDAWSAAIWALDVVLAQPRPASSLPTT